MRDTIWPEIAKWHRQLPEALKAMIDVQAERIVVVQDPQGAFAVRRTASKCSTARSFCATLGRRIDNPSRGPSMLNAALRDW